MSVTALDYQHHLVNTLVHEKDILNFFTRNKNKFKEVKAFPTDLTIPFNTTVHKGLTENDKVFNFSMTGVSPLNTKSLNSLNSNRYNNYIVMYKDVLGRIIPTMLVIDRTIELKEMKKRLFKVLKASSLILDEETKNYQDFHFTHKVVSSKLVSKVGQSNLILSTSNNKEFNLSLEELSNVIVIVNK